jgi:hypothetical protein
MAKLDPYREYREPPRAADANWLRAIGRAEISLAAEGALHDFERAKHRPGGKIKPRKRWASDGKNIFGQF